VQRRDGDHEEGLILPSPPPVRERASGLPTTPASEDSCEGSPGYPRGGPRCHVLFMLGVAEEREASDMNDGVLSAIGNTPLVRLKRIFPDLRLRLYAKLEALNPGGSMKDRPAFTILSEALTSGVVTRDTVVIESSSGNMGIGLAQACSYLGLRFICVVDPKTTAQNVRLLEAYGAEVDRVTEPDERTGEFLQARLNRVR